MQNNSKTSQHGKSVLKSKNSGKFVYRFIKRFLDISGSIVGIIILSPLFLVAAILVKLDSKGPVFYAHKRIGKGGKLFSIYKFRTMVINADEVLKKLDEKTRKEFEKNFKLENDPRITPIGKFLRVTSIDELPQLVNILKGEMSIVGPRPIVTDEIKKYGKYADKLVTVKPGLAGYWQANGRSNTTYDERVKMDMYYIDNRSLWMDIRIIFRTAISVFRKEGAK